MSWENTRQEFDNFSATFDLIFRATRSKEPLYPLCLKVLREHKPRSVLDCACGQGGPAIAIHKLGVSVIGTELLDRLSRSGFSNFVVENVGETGYSVVAEAV